MSLDELFRTIHYKLMNEPMSIHPDNFEIPLNQLSNGDSICTFTVIQASKSLVKSNNNWVISKISDLVIGFLNPIENPIKIKLNLGSFVKHYIVNPNQIFYPLDNKYVLSMLNLCYVNVSLELEDSLDCPDLKINYGLTQNPYRKLLATSALIYKHDSDSYLVSKCGCIGHITDTSQISSLFSDGPHSWSEYFIPSFTSKSIQE